MAKATIPIYHDDDFERLAELRMEVSIAERRYDAAKAEASESERYSPRRFGDEAESDDVAEKKAALDVAQQAFNEFVDEASERAEMWVLKPIGHEEYRDLLLAHPPRKVPGPARLVAEGDAPTPDETTHPDDVGFNVNTDTFGRALLLFVDPDDDGHRTIVEPAFEFEAVMKKRVRRLSRGQFQSMWTTAYMANEGGVADPKAARF